MLSNLGAESTEEGMFWLVVIRTRWGYFVVFLLWRQCLGRKYCYNAPEERCHFGRVMKASYMLETLWLLRIYLFGWKELWFEHKHECVCGHIRMECSSQEYARKWSEKIMMKDKYVRKIPWKTLNSIHRSLKMYMKDTPELCGFENRDFTPTHTPTPLFSKLQCGHTFQHLLHTHEEK